MVGNKTWVVRMESADGLPRDDLNHAICVQLNKVLGNRIGNKNDLLAGQILPTKHRVKPHLYSHGSIFKRGLKIECLTLAPAAKGISYMVMQRLKTVPSRFSIQASNFSHLHVCMCCS